jgi:hypothetical protein
MSSKLSFPLRDIGKLFPGEIPRKVIVVMKSAVCKLAGIGNNA